MDRQFTAEDIMNAKEVYFYNRNTLYIILEDDKAYGYTRFAEGWYHKSNFEDYFDSPLMIGYIEPITKEEAVKLYEEWLGEEKSKEGN